MKLRSGLGSGFAGALKNGTGTGSRVPILLISKMKVSIENDLFCGTGTGSRVPVFVIALIKIKIKKFLTCSQMIFLAKASNKSAVRL